MTCKNLTSTTLLDTAFRATYPTVKGLTPNPTSDETSVKSTQAYFPPTHLYTITSTGLSVKKFTDVSFFNDTSTHLNMSKGHPKQSNYVFKVRKLFTMICMLPKGIQACITANKAHLIDMK